MIGWLPNTDSHFQPPNPHIQILQIDDDDDDDDYNENMFWWYQNIYPSGDKFPLIIYWSY